ncbi:MAG: KpsF/GutQ family sugar-phosphate isomerase [Halocynthiibacter sp.]
MMRGELDQMASIRGSLVDFSNGLQAVTEALEDPSLAANLTGALDAVYGMKGRLILSGVGKSGHIAKKLAATFASTGTPAFFVHASEASHGDLGMVTEDDVLLLLSWSGETKELSDIIAYGQRFGVPMIAITGGEKSILAQKSTYPLVLPKAKEACPHNLAPTTSTLMQLAIGDAIAVTLLKMRGFTEESFRNFHPGGKLGMALSPVADVMVKADGLPLVEPDLSVMGVLGEISSKKQGIAGVVDGDQNLLGVITDGDIRRYLEAKADGSMKSVLWDAKAHEIMTPVSVTITSDRLLARAMNVMQTNKISACFVVEDGKAVGLVTMLQLLQNGVA